MANAAPTIFSVIALLAIWRWELRGVDLFLTIIAAAIMVVGSLVVLSIKALQKSVNGKLDAILEELRRRRP